MADQDLGLREEEIEALVKQAADGADEALLKLFEIFQSYIESRANRYLNYRFIEKDDLVDIGKRGFYFSLRNYDPGKSNGAKFKTYATTYIDREIEHEIKALLNPMGLKMPEGVLAPTDYTLIDPTMENGIDIPVPEHSEDEEENRMPDVEEVLEAATPTQEKFSETRRALQIIEVLKNVTDDEHSITKEELTKLLKFYRAAVYGKDTKPEADNTLTNSIVQILAEVNPLTYTEENKDKYRIRYSGYKENRVDRRLNQNEKGVEITDFRYHHPFANEELDQLIRIVCMSRILADDEKNMLISKLVNTASNYYHNSLWDGEKTRFDPSEIHDRFVKRGEGNNPQLIENIRRMQHAINNFEQVTFFMNYHTADHEMIPRNKRRHRLSPYHLVVYHDVFYCIGLRSDDPNKKRIWHYRLDLMTDIQPYEPKRKPKPIELKPHFEGLPIFNSRWKPEKYMAEHLYMGYDEPQSIWIRIPKDGGYTILYSWFADHYKKIKDDGDYDIVSVTTSPNMIVQWALQYSDYVEIMDLKIREKIREKTKEIAEKYRSSEDSTE